MWKMRIEAILGCPPDRELASIQLFADTGGVVLEKCPMGRDPARARGLTFGGLSSANRKEWVFSCLDLQRVIAKAKERLIGSSTSDTVAKNWDPIALADDGTMSVLSDNECCAFFAKGGGEKLICFPARAGSSPRVFLLQDVSDVIDEARNRIGH